MQMTYIEAIVKFFSRLVILANQMKLCGEKISELLKVEKLLRSLPAKFDHVVVTMEEFKYLSEIKLEEWQASRETHDFRLKQINLEKVSKQVLHAKFFTKKMKENSSNNNKDKERWKKKCNESDDARKNSRSHGETTKNNAPHNQKLKNNMEMKEV